MMKMKFALCGIALLSLIASSWAYADNTLASPGSRDRSLMTLAGLIAQNQTAEMPCHLGVALQNGIKPSEISAVITHLAFYVGWENAMSAAAIANSVFVERGIDSDSIVLGDMVLIIDEIALEDAETHGLLQKLWLLPDLEPRDRSLVTRSALSATVQ